MTGPEQHAATVAFKQWALAEDRPDAEWVITREDARELVALAERADRLERERGVAQEWGEFHQRRCGEALGERDSARAEADRLREALEWFAKDGAWIVSSAGIKSGRYGFQPPSWGVNSTPWGVARTALAGTGPTQAARLREAAQALVNAHARRHPNAAFWTLSERMALAEVAAALSVLDDREAGEPRD